MMNVIKEMLSYPFLVRALAGGMMVSLCASLLGVSLVLRRYSMIGDGLSHVSFGSLSIALAMGWSPLKVSIPVVVVAAFFLLRITENSRIKSDAAIALISASAWPWELSLPPHHRAYHRCKQLYVRKYSGYEPGGCEAERSAVSCGAGAVCGVL